MGGRFSFPDLSANQTITYSPGVLFNSGLHFLLYQARAKADPSELRPGIEFADRLIQGALRGKSLPIVLETLLLRAQMHAILGDHPASQADYARALELAEPEGFIGVFIEQGPPVADALAELIRRNQLEGDQRDFADRILAAFSQIRSTARGRDQGPAGDQPVEKGSLVSVQPETLVEPLTGRETDVLLLMAEGLKYKEIAVELFVSLNTVRFHVKSIYGKLNVNNRTQAIEVARQLHIL